MSVHLALPGASKALQLLEIPRPRTWAGFGLGDLPAQAKPREGPQQVQKQAHHHVDANGVGDCNPKKKREGPNGLRTFKEHPVKLIDTPGRRVW